MSNQNNKKTLSDLDFGLDSNVRTLQALVGDNLGHRTLKLSIPIKTFIEISAVGNRATIDNIEIHRDQYVAQRELIRSHAVGLGKYILMGLVRAHITRSEKLNKNIIPEIYKIRDELGNPAYTALQPIVCNIRECDPGGGGIEIEEIYNKGINTGVYNVSFSQKHTFWVIDGQHRREAFDIVLKYLSDVTKSYKYPKKGLYAPIINSNDLIKDNVHNFWSELNTIALGASSISVECHLGLNKEQEQQLFYDLNANVRNVQKSYAYNFDHSDEINKFVEENLVLSDEILKFTPSQKDNSDWTDDSGVISRKDINNVTSLLCLGNTASKKATPAYMKSLEEYPIIFWKNISKIQGFGIEGAKTKTVVAQTVFLKALAKLSWELTYGHSKLRDRDGYEVFMKAIRTGTIDFSHKNKLWTTLMMEESERNKKYPNISDYLQIPKETNLEAGVIDSNGCIRFGSRHNDIFPRIADLIRFTLKLKPRPRAAKNNN